MPRVRFLLHGAERSGPPIYLLRLLEEWSQRPPGFDAELVIARHGPLVDQFATVVPTTVSGLQRRSPERLLERALATAGLPGLGAAVVDRATRRRAGSELADVTVVNGATQPTTDLLRALNPSGEVLLIAHELSTGWCSNIDASSRQLLLDRVDRYLAVSVAVSEFLQERLGIPRDRIEVCRPPVGSASHAVNGAARSNHRWNSSETAAYARSGHRQTVVVGGAGVHDWRKAPELWLQLAARVCKRLRSDEVRFVWFGGHQAGTAPAWPIMHELRHLGLENQVQFVGEVDDLELRLRSVDIFVSTAREDAYPLVCAEACATGVPVVTFDVGGAAELIADSGCGEAINYPDLGTMADRVVELARDPVRRELLGGCGTAFATENLAPKVVAPTVSEWIMAGPNP